MTVKQIAELQEKKAAQERQLQELDSYLELLISTTLAQLQKAKPATPK